MYLDTTTRYNIKLDFIKMCVYCAALYYYHYQYSIPCLMYVIGPDRLDKLLSSTQ